MTGYLQQTMKDRAVAIGLDRSGKEIEYNLPDGSLSSTRLIVLTPK
jgi:hypothetical protein